MHIFLTGSSGFIGSYFLKHAIELGAKVTTVNRREVPTINENHINLNKNISEIKHDDFVGIDVVVHLACAGVSPKLVTFSELYEINFLASITLMQEAIKGGVGRQNNLLTYCNLIAVFLGKVRISKFAGQLSRPPTGVSPISQKAAREFFSPLHP